MSTKTTKMTFSVDNFSNFFHVFFSIVALFSNKEKSVYLIGRYYARVPADIAPIGQNPLADIAPLRGFAPHSRVTVMFKVRARVTLGCGIDAPRLLLFFKNPSKIMHFFNIFLYKIS